MIKWHRLFGLGLTDYFTGSRYRIEMEKDLSIKQQLLDILIIEQEAQPVPLELPDGLENLARHNLITYKSLRQPLNAWTLDELIGHYVNYRKQASGSSKILLPANDFRLYAVSTRLPQRLRAETQHVEVGRGIYEVKWGSQGIRVIVPCEAPKIKRNAIWHLFSGNAESVQYGATHYKWRQKSISSIRNELFKFYQTKGIAMSYTVEDYKRAVKEEVLASLTPEERLRGLPPEELLKRLPLQERFKGLTKKQIETYLKRLSAKPRGRKSGVK